MICSPCLLASRRARSPVLRAWGLAALLLCAWLFAVGAAPVYAQAGGPDLAKIEKELDASRKRFDSSRKLLENEDRSVASDAALVALREVSQAVRASAQEAVAALEPEFAALQARLGELGAPADGSPEAPDVAARRASLEKSRNALDGQIKMARLLIVESEQAIADVRAQRRAGFQARLGLRTVSFADERFRQEARSDMPADADRLAALADEFRGALAAVPKAGWLALALVAPIIIGIRIGLGRLLLAVTASRVPAARLRRSFYAMAVVVLTAVTPVLLGQSLYYVLRDNATLSSAVDGLLKGMVGALAFGGLIVGLGQAFLSAERPSWRLASMPDLLAVRLRWFPWLLGATLVVAWLSDQIAMTLDVSFITTVMINGVVALALSLTLGVALWRGERLRRLARAQPEKYQMPPQPWWLSLLVTTAWVAVALALICLFMGYVALASFLVKQVAWTVVVLCAAYLLIALFDDGFETLLGASPGSDDTGLPRRREQAAVLLAGVCRLSIGLVTVAMLLAPFGEGPAELLRRASILSEGLTVGAISIRPGTVLQGLAVLVLCLALVGLVRRWLADRYLPTTGMDPGMAGSAATLFGYAGVVLSVALAMVAMGIGMERVAWVASALSVGIGFGLQAVVQNFVSGLIMLAERPVKVGDWVALGGVEGDIRRINARATEIQMGDRSTLIVPNSEFITKTVRNVTHTNPLGLVSFKLPMPLDTDADRAREVILAAFTAHASVLEAPAPAVFLDGVDGRNLVFNATGYVASPRMAYGVRSELLFDVLRMLAEAGIVLAPPVPGVPE